MTRVRSALMALAACAGCAGAGAQTFEWESREGLVREADSPSPRIRLDDSRRRLEDLRDDATAEDYRTIRIQSKNGRPAGYRRVPTEEFAARIERAEQDRDIAEFETKARERSP
jgi:hypothetical protein